VLVCLCCCLLAAGFGKMNWASWSEHDTYYACSKQSVVMGDYAYSGIPIISRAEFSLQIYLYVSQACIVMLAPEAVHMRSYYLLSSTMLQYEYGPGCNQEPTRPPPGLDRNR
jgi:hypothetical protein